jgi:hypothetical protein
MGDLPESTQTPAQLSVDPHVDGDDPPAVRFGPKQMFQLAIPRLYSVNTSRDFTAVTLVVAFYWTLALFAFSGHSAIFRGLAAYGVTVIAVGIIIQSGFWREWFFWMKAEPLEPGVTRAKATRRDVFRAIAAALSILSMFAVLSAQIRGSLLPNHVIHEGNFVWAYTVGYLWNVVDSIPVLNVTGTYHWMVPPLFGDRLGQHMELAFRLLVVAPGLSVITRFVQRRESEEPQSPPAG